MAYAYDDNFRMTGLSYDDGTPDAPNEATYLYDSDGLLTKAVDFSITRNTTTGFPETVEESETERLKRTFDLYGDQSKDEYGPTGSRFFT